MEAYKVIKPLSYVAEIFCLIPFSFDPSKPDSSLFKPFSRGIFYYLRMLGILAVVIGSILYKQFAVRVYNSKSAIGNAVEFAHYNCRLIGTVLCVLSINFYNRNIISFMNALPRIERHINEIGHKVNYEKLAPLSYGLLVVLSAKFVVMEIPYFVNEFYKDWVRILDFLIFNVPLLLIHIVSLQWVQYLTFLGLHLKSLNRILKSLKYRQCWVVDDFIKTSPIAPVQILKRCGSIYGKLCRESRAINNAFAWQFLLILPGFFVEIVLKSFNICQTIKNKTSVDAATVVSDIIHFLVVLEIVIPCASVKDESVKYADILGKIDTHYENDADFEEVMSGLLLQAYHQKIEFTANGVFSLDGTLIYSIFGALTTYLVILLQFDI